MTGIGLNVHSIEFYHCLLSVKNVRSANFILLLDISCYVSCKPMEKTNHVNSCDSRVHASKNGKTMEQCKEEARENTKDYQMNYYYFIPY